jgi:type VI secretion system VasD/TssJ family lipoprotein
MAGWLVLLAVWLPACATTDWTYEKDAVRLHLQSDPSLNLFAGSPHTLILCVYNLRDPNAFHQAVDERDGLVKLLECARFDPSVTYAKRYVVQPRQQVTETLDRAEGTRYVAVVAGYSELRKEHVTRFYAIPVTAITKRPDRLDIDLYLGPQGIQAPRVTR